MHYGFSQPMLWALAILGVLVVTVPTFAETAAIRITDANRLKPLHPDTLITRDGAAKAAIVTPESREYQKLALAIQEAIRSASGALIPIRLDSELADRYGKVAETPAQNLILLGNVETSGLVAHLYAFKYCSVDAVYPGDDGYILQTISDPWGNGANVILLGGSTIAGIERAVDRFCASMPSGGTISIGRTMDATFGEDTARRFGDLLADPTDADIAEKVKAGDKAFRAGIHGGLFPQINSAGLMYMRTGKEGYAKLFRAMLFLADDLYHQNLGTYGGPWGMDADFSFADLIAAWDAVEESSSLSAEDRLRITNIILDYISYWESYWSIKPVGMDEIRNNHCTFTSLGFHFAADYFGKYYRLPQAENWRKIADGAFSAQAKSFKPQEDSNSYQWITLNHMVRYSLAGSDQSYFNNGNARIGGDLAIMTMDNLGYQVSFGDVGGFHGGNQEMYIWRPLAVMTGDGRYTWAYEKGMTVRPAYGFNAYSNSIKPKEPRGLLGVKWLPTDPRFYSKWNGKGTVPQNRTFEKLTFRTSFDPKQAYLILDGISACGHGHYDGNSILRLTDRGRIWLGDCDYIKAQPKFHNMVLVFRDGQSFGLPTFSELELAADLDSVGFSRTTTPGCSGTDWSRNIIWDRGHTFVVIDEITARAADEYSLRCHWQGIGAPQIKGHDFQVTQQDTSFTIRNLDGSALRTWDDPVTGKNWTAYKHADPIIRVLQQVKKLRLESGSRTYFLNVMATHPNGKSPVRAESAGESSVLVGSGKSRMLIGVQHGTNEILPGLDTDAQVYAVSSDRLALGNATSLHLRGKCLFRSAEPVSIEITAGGKITVVTCNPVSIGVLRDGLLAPVEVGTGKHQVSADIPPVLGLELPDPQPVASITTKPADDGAKKLSAIAEFKPESGRILALACDADGIYAGGADGKAYAFFPDGKAKWDFDTKSEVRALWVGSLEKNTAPVLAVGTADGSVYLLDRSGNTLWKQQLPYYKRTPSLVYFTAADLAGDGDRVLIVGSENWHHYAFDSRGKKVWQYESVHASTAGTAVDLNGDGKQEVIAGTEYYWWHAVNPDGAKLWQYRPSTGPRTTCVEALRTPAKALVLFGGADGYIHAVDAACHEAWLHNTGDEITGLALDDIDGDGIQEIIVSSLSFNVSAVRSDGTRIWRRDLGEPVLCMTLADLNADGAREICVGMESGRVIAMGRDGSVLASYQASGPVKRLATIPGWPDRLAVVHADGMEVLRW